VHTGTLRSVQLTDVLAPAAWLPVDRLAEGIAAQLSTQTSAIRCIAADDCRPLRRPVR